MASASTTALSWRPLPLRPSSHSHARLNRVRISAISSSPPRTCSSSSSSSGSTNNSLRTSVLRSPSCSPFLDVRLKYPSSNLELKRKTQQKQKQERRGRGVVTIRAGMRLDPGGGNNDNNNNNNGDGGVGRVVVNVALAAGLTYLTLTGKLGWVFDTLVSLWLLAVLVPVVTVLGFLWFAQREIVKGACPNCGQAFQVFEFAVKDQQSSLCPYCSQPFKLDDHRQFVRDEPRFSNEGFGGFGGFTDGFGGFGKGASSRKNEDPGGTVVDVEAEVVDRD